MNLIRRQFPVSAIDLSFTNWDIISGDVRPGCQISISGVISAVTLDATAIPI